MNESGEILIVDDIPDQIAFAGEILRSEGYKVYAATSGRAALDFLKKKRPELIVLDIKMEEMDGLDVCRAVKSCSETADIPVIFLTAESSAETIRLGFEAGCCDYVVKPFIREEYLARIKTHLEISRKSIALEAANNELKLFSSAVSHDLKSPLAVIKMLIETLDDELGEDKSEDAARIMEILKAKSDHLTLMIERLLEFSRMCSITPEKEPLDLAEIFREAFTEQSLIEPDRKVSLNIGELPVINGDDVLIRMLVKNLISNAFKFTRQREDAVITVDASNDGCYTIISVKDNGAGFDMSYSDKLFKVFQRLHTSEEFEGTGVGLALADRIMKRHGGRIEAYGEVDKGAEFKLFFEN